MHGRSCGLHCGVCRRRHRRRRCCLCPSLPAAARPARLVAYRPSICHINSHPSCRRHGGASRRSSPAGAAHRAARPGTEEGLRAREGDLQHCRAGARARGGHAARGRHHLRAAGHGGRRAALCTLRRLGGRRPVARAPPPHPHLLPGADLRPQRGYLQGCVAVVLVTRPGCCRLWKGFSARGGRGAAEQLQRGRLQRSLAAQQRWGCAAAAEALAVAPCCDPSSPALPRPPLLPSHAPSIETQELDPYKTADSPAASTPWEQARALPPADQVSRYADYKNVPLLASFLSGGLLLRLQSCSGCCWPGCSAQVTFRRDRALWFCCRLCCRVGQLFSAGRDSTLLRGYGQ